MKLTATTLNNRIEAIDIMRGFALLGIFIANMLMFHSPFLHMDPLTFYGSGEDAATFRWIDIFVQGSFYPIFAFLFGYGLNMQYEKAIDRKQPYESFMAKRLTVLLCFGLIHALFLWSGDVLFSYATLGFSLILFVRIPAKWLLSLAVVLYAIPAGLLYFMTKLVAQSSLLEGELEDVNKVAEMIAVFGDGSFGQIFIARLIEWLVYGLSSAFLGIFIVLPFIMIGAAMSKWKVIERAAEIKGKVIIVTVVALAVGIWIKVLPHMGAATLDLVQLQDTFGGGILAAGYVGVFLLLCTSPLFLKITGPIGKAGRMSLTTYISQSIIATTIFYGYGFGLYGTVSLMTGTLIALGVFVIQVIFATLWFKKFKMGPLESLWRILTYGKTSKK